ncbi:hypothetical protein WJ47_02610 [Burkholderia ubonensis]|uniref:Putative tail fiber protein gp53-like C-terminal domain-containing protein n=1 Tax=Burkholderia ubonensis TaxID=101571 RepID=A0AB73FST4_9BURK|nr:hypothetical protein [Burkholderia ubonensis]KVK88705.1 hypothetical protein WJ44_29160 [Burkholderia ubonensis]KVL72681.1 hypothetical protein WJ47_02610 [Burkholderia ubonensis]KVM23310.1 hypothetical protein WJ53_17680 [Burkholderia ubonensis]KVM29608.1 hypothetical protein WJ54_11615 [Burkholderia ubonensis]
MANQPEQDQWDAGVYQIEKTDPVLGGLGGIANAPLLNLANRTKYLYSRIQEILGVGKGYAIAGGTANAITCSYTPAVSAIADGQTFKGKVAAANTGATTFTPNPAAQGGIAPLPVYGLDLQPLSGGEIVGQFTVQYNASLNSGGGAFVLIENPGGITRASAPALADNSAAIAPTSWIRSIFAPLASPAFTGSPQAPVPPQFDNSTKLATTAFVQQALGNFQGFVPLTASATLTASQTGSFIEARGTSGYSIALPPPLTPGLVFTIFNANSNSVTLSTSIGAIYSANNSSSSYILTVAQSAQLVSDGSNWVVISGQAVGALLTNGYQKLPSGLIIQWGAATTNSSGVATVAFPIAFPNQQLGAVASINATLTTGLVSTYNFSKPSMSIGTQSYQTNAGASAAVTYLAWGF